jgi:hypothetical protein
VRPRHRLAHDEALRVAHAGQRAELGVTALDQLCEERRGETGGGGGVAGRSELGAMTGQRLLLDRVDVGDVEDERRRGGVVDEVVTDPFRPPRILARHHAAQAGAEDRLAQQAAGAAVIGMAVLPVGDGDGARPMRTHAADHGVDLCLVVRRQAAIRQGQVEPQHRAEHGARLGGFGHAVVRRAVRAELAARQVDQADAVAAPRVQRDRPAHPDLDVVGMRPEHQQVQRHCRDDTSGATTAGGPGVACAGRRRQASVRSHRRHHRVGAAPCRPCVAISWTRGSGGHVPVVW